ncbi:MAG TPA: ATP-binding protein [Methanoregulaceae archaeon]|nr:ATP-binding protein [Methanoregulaceae archaeon]
MPGRAEFTISAEIPALTEILDGIGILLRQNNVSVDLISDIELAVDEVVTNSILHGYGGGGTGTIHIVVQLRPDRVEMTIEDQGTPFDPTTFEPKTQEGDISERVPGGLGIILIRNVMDKIMYRRDGRTNILHLVKLIRNRYDQES